MSQQEVYNVLRRIGEATSVDIAKEMGCATRLVNSNLRSMVRYGEVAVRSEVEKGVWKYYYRLAKVKP